MRFFNENKSDIYLRKLEEKDLEKSHKYINNPEINEIMGYLPVSFDEQVNWYKTTIANKNKFIFAICTVKDDEYIGNIGLGNIDYIHRNAMLSIFIYDSKNRNKGYGSKAVDLALDFAFNRLNLHKVIVQTSEDYPPLKTMLNPFVLLVLGLSGFIKDAVLLKKAFYENRILNMESI